MTIFTYAFKVRIQNPLYFKNYGGSDIKHYEQWMDTSQEV